MTHVEFVILLGVLLWLVRRVPPPSIIEANLNGMQNQFDILNQKLDKLLEKEALNDSI